MKTYLAFDGRYHSDPDRAMCLEVLGKMSEDEAREDFLSEWGDVDAVLVAFTEDEDGICRDPEIVYTDM